MLFERDSLFICNYSDNKWNNIIKSVKVPSSWNVMIGRVRKSGLFDPEWTNLHFKEMVSYINLLRLFVDDDDIDISIIFMVYAMFNDEYCMDYSMELESPRNINRRLSKLFDIPFETLDKIWMVSSFLDEIDIRIACVDDIDKAYDLLDKPVL